MATRTPNEVVNLIRSTSLRMRTGLWLIPLAMLGTERDEAAQLALDAVDLRSVHLTRLPEGARFAGLSAESLMELFDLVASASGTYDAALIYNMDLLLARLSHAGRRQAWQYLHHSMPHRARGLLVTLPAGADELLPSLDDLAIWQREGRVASYSR